MIARRLGIAAFVAAAGALAYAVAGGGALGRVLAAVAREAARLLT